MSTKSELDDKLTKLSHFSNPPADVVTEALVAYAARVQDLEDFIRKLDARIGEEVSFQSFIRKSEQEIRNDMAKRHQDEKRALIKELGFAATIRDRVMTAQWQGRKTVKVEALLEGRPVEDSQ